MNSRALWASWAISGVLVLGLAACALEHNTDPLPSGEQLLWQSHDAKPPWVSAPPPRDADPVQFVGVSFRHQTERGAREVALANAATAALRFAVQKADKTVEVEASQSGSTAQALSESAEVVDRDAVEASGVLFELAEKDYYIEKWSTRDGHSFFKSYALVEIPSARLQELAERAERRVR